MVVVDDESTDATAAVAAAAGARVVAGRPLPEGWVGKPWALQQGLEVATGHWLLTLDADVTPPPGLVGALVAAAERGGWDWASAGGRFAVGRTRPTGSATRPCSPPSSTGSDPPARVAVPVGRLQANGQCTITRRAVLAAAGATGPPPAT